MQNNNNNSVNKKTHMIRRSRMRKEINHQNKMQEREIYNNSRQRGLESHPQGVQRLPDLSMLERRT
jgi:hypothetical protein